MGKMCNTWVKEYSREKKLITEKLPVYKVLEGKTGAGTWKTSPKCSSCSFPNSLFSKLFWTNSTALCSYTSRD